MNKHTSHTTIIAAANAKSARCFAGDAAIVAANGRTYYTRKLDAVDVQFTTPDRTRHSFMDNVRVRVTAIYEDSAHTHFVGLLIDRWSSITLYVAPFVKSFRIDYAQTKRMNAYALDGSGVAIPESRKMRNNRVAAQERRERERAHFAYAHAARAHK